MFQRRKIVEVAICYSNWESRMCILYSEIYHVTVAAKFEWKKKKNRMGKYTFVVKGSNISLELYFWIAICLGDWIFEYNSSKMQKRQINIVMFVKKKIEVLRIGIWTYGSHDSTP